MCCRGDLCFRINCHCVCYRCRNCDDCARVFGRGGLALTLGGGALGSIGAGIVRSGTQPASAPPDDPLKFRQPPKPKSGMKAAISEGLYDCACQ